MTTKQRIDQLKALMPSLGIGPNKEIKDALDELIVTSELLAKCYDLLYVIANSNSAFNDKARPLVDEIVYGTTDPRVVAAAKTFLERSGQLRDAGAKYGLKK